VREWVCDVTVLAIHVEIVHAADEVVGGIQVMCVVNDVELTAGVRRGVVVVVVVVVWIVHRRTEGHDWLVVDFRIRVVREDEETLFRFGITEFHVESRGLGCGSRTRVCSLLFCCTLLPFQDASPIK
jgi:hypothetical protein